MLERDAIRFWRFMERRHFYYILDFFRCDWNLFFWILLKNRFMSFVILVAKSGAKISRWGWNCRWRKSAKNSSLCCGSYTIWQLAFSNSIFFFFSFISVDLSNKFLWFKKQLIVGLVSCNLQLPLTGIINVPGGPIWSTIALETKMQILP